MSEEMKNLREGGEFELPNKETVLYPVEPICIATYLAMADEGLIDISREEYMYFLAKWRRKVGEE